MRRNARRSVRHNRWRVELFSAGEVRGKVRPGRRFGWVFGLLLPVAAASIAANALLLQEAPHPAPLFATRTAPEWAGPASTGRLALPVPRPSLREGSRRDAAADGDPIVFAVQQALGLAGYGPLTPDGLLGPRTSDAIRRFQLEEGLAVTGRIDDALIRRLSSVGALGGE